MSGRILAADDMPPPAETPEPEPEQQETPPAAPAEPEPAPASEEKPKPEPDAASELRKRLDALTREKWEARRQAEALAAELEQLRRPPPPQGQADPVEAAKAQLRMEAAQQNFNAACNRVFEAGRAEFATFEEDVSRLNAVGAGQRPDFLTAITALPEGHRVYHQRASTLDEAARVLSLHPMAMAVELARLAQTPAPAPAPAPPPVVSQAPPPIRPIGGGGRSPMPMDKLSTADWIRARDKEVAERRERGER